MRLSRNARPVRPQTQRGEGEIAASVDAFRRILRAIRVMARKGELSTGLSAAQTFVLSVLIDRPGTSVNELAGATLTDRSSVAAVVDRLVAQGYVVREQSTSDRRRASVSITPTGRRAIRHAASPPPTVALITAMRALERKDQRALASGLTALARAMGVDGEPAGMLFEDAVRRSSGRRRT
jgi:DNA-binding MarR family transcriptional regulator